MSDYKGAFSQNEGQRTLAGSGSSLGGDDLYDDFKFPHKRAISRWIVLSLALFSITATFVAFFHIRAYSRSASLSGKIGSGEQKIVDLQSQVRGLSSSKKLNAVLKTKMAYFKKYAKKYEEKIAFLHEISSLIPPNTWLKKFSCERRGKKGTKEVVSITGYAPTYDELMEFYTGLSRLQDLKHCSLKYDKSKVEGKEGDVLKFSIRAEIK